MEISWKISVIVSAFIILAIVCARVLFFGEPSVLVEVAVEEVSGGRPLVGMEVTAQGESGGQPVLAETDSSGRAGFVDLEAGLTTFRVSIPGYRDFFQTVTLKDGANDEVSFLLEVGTAEVKGRVLNAQNRLPVEGVSVSVGGVVGETDYEGRFVLDGVIVGTPTLKAQKTRFQDLLIELSLDKGMVKNVGNLLLRPRL